MASIHTLFFFILITTTLHLISPVTSTCNHGDYNVLITLKHSLGDPPSLSSWKPNSDCCSSWRGIECDDQKNRVTSIDIESAPDVSGTLPADISNLTSLQNLFLQRLPGLRGPIPASVGSLPRLSQFIIDTTGISGEIPSSLGGLKELSQLFLTNNSLTGRIPASLGGLPKLFQLVLSYNYLTGPIPATLANCPSLSDILLSNNQLSGGIPSKIPPKLNSLTLSDNQLTGTLPATLASSGAVSIDVSGNHLYGDASVLFGANSTFRTIFISRNDYSFNFSAVVLPLVLQQLDISQNKVFGSIPAGVDDNFGIDYFNVSYNLLVGKIPQGGEINSLDPSSFDHNLCLCGRPLKQRCPCCFH